RRAGGFAHGRAHHGQFQEQHGPPFLTICPTPFRRGIIMFSRSMFQPRSGMSFGIAAALLSAATGVYAQGAAQPQVLKALEAQGLTVVEEFDVGSELRAFAGVAGRSPDLSRRSGGAT